MQLYTGLLRLSVSSTILITSILLICIASPRDLIAQLPGTISYQGQILGEDQRPVPDGYYRLDVALYDAEEAAEPLWRESHVAQFTGGLFSIYLGSISPIELSFDRQYFLGVSFDGQGEMSHRTPLSTSPYAMRSEIAGEIQGGSVRSINGRQGELRIVGAGGAVVTEADGVITIGVTNPKSMQADKVLLSPTSAQSSSDPYTLLHLDETSTGTPDLINIEVGGSDVLLVENDGDLTTIGSITAEGGSFGDERLENVADPTAAQDAATKSYVDNENAAQTTSLESYADQAEADAKAYTHAQNATQTAALEAYADQAEADARAYSDAQDATQTANLEAYSDQSEADAKSYADSLHKEAMHEATILASETENVLRSYSDYRNSQLAGNLRNYADQAEADANSYSNAQDAIQTTNLEAYADQAEADAIAHSDAADATQTSNLEAYADQSEVDAKAYADAQDATQTSNLEAYADQSEADAQAYSDAQDAVQTANLETYADQAESDAKSYSDAQDAAQTSNLEAYADQSEADAKAYADQQDAAQNVTAEPFLTFDAGSARLTDNRVLAAGTGVSLSDAGTDDGAMTVAIGQDVATTAAPTFDGATLTNMPANTTSTDVVVSNGGTLEMRSTGSLAGEFNGEFWTTEGNAGTTSESYIGTSDKQSLRLLVNGGVDNRMQLSTNGSTLAGRGNSIASTSDGGTIMGGANNRLDAHVSNPEYQSKYSTIAGGRGMRIHASGSFGFLGNNIDGTRGMLWTQPNSAVFGNVDLILNNNDDEASSIRLYERSSQGINFTAIKAGDQSRNLTYTLPTAFPTADGQVLSSTTSGTMSWIDNGVTSLTGTTDQVLVTTSTGDVTLSLPQNIDQNATPTFDGVTLDNLSSNSSSSQLIVTNGGALESRSIASLAEEITDSFWSISGNAGTAAGPDYIGTSDATALHIYVNGGTDNSLILNTNGSLQRGTDPNSRGRYAVDLQNWRSSPTQVAYGTSATIGGGYANSGSGHYSTIAGGHQNVASSTSTVVAGGQSNTASGFVSSVGGGALNRANGSFSVVSGGSQGSAGGTYSTVSGGQNNAALANWSAVSGGYKNYVYGVYSSILGGVGLTLRGSSSFGFVGGGRPMTVHAHSTALFGNTNLWLANNDGSARQLRFYEANSTTGTFPNGTNYTALQAGVQSSDIVYTLPTSAPATSGKVLTSMPSGVMSWVDGPTGAQRFSNSSATVNTLTLANGNSGGTALEITNGGIVLDPDHSHAMSGHPSYVANTNTIGVHTGVAVISTRYGPSGYGRFVKVPVTGTKGQVIYLVNTCGETLTVQNGLGGNVNVANNAGVTLVYNGSGWVILR